MENTFYKTAEAHYQFLLEKYKESLDSKDVEKIAYEIVGKLAERKEISTPLEAIEKIAEYREKGLDDLRIVRKALDFSPVEKTAETAKAPELGLLSDTPSGDGQDNLTSFLLEDYN